MRPFLIITSAQVTGATEWHATESRELQRFRRGIERREVKCRDERGNPCLRARRMIRIIIQLQDGVTYSFERDLSDMRYRHDECVDINMRVHGMIHHIHTLDYDDMPGLVRSAYELTYRRTRAALRIARECVRALPATRPIPNPMPKRRTP